EIRDAVIVAGDAVVRKGGKIYEKPRDLKEAAKFLGELSGGDLEFVTSLVVLRPQTGKILSAVEVSRITFRSLTDREIKDYIARYPVLRCAGGFEGRGGLPFPGRIPGSHNFMSAIPVTPVN